MLSHALSTTEQPVRQVPESLSDFFRLFENFEIYIKFFLLEDLVTSDISAVLFFLPSDGFARSPVPVNVAEYIRYKMLAMEFLHARNRRMNSFQELFDVDASSGVLMIHLAESVCELGKWRRNFCRLFARLSHLFSTAQSDQCGTR